MPIDVLLIKPCAATNKISDSGGDERFLYAVSEMQGWRISEWFTTFVALCSALALFVNSVSNANYSHGRRACGCAEVG